MRKLQDILSSRTAQLGMAGAIVLALSMPALADHFSFDDLGEGETPTSENLHVECPSEAEEPSEEELEACEAAVTGAFQELEDYDHPENHGKYVSYLAHCVTGGPGKGEVMRQVAQATEGEAELAVRLCSESKLQPEAQVSPSGKGLGKGKDDPSEEPELEGEESEAGASGKAAGKSGKGRGPK